MDWQFPTPLSRLQHGVFRGRFINKVGHPGVPARFDLASVIAAQKGSALAKLEGGSLDMDWNVYVCVRWEGGRGRMGRRRKKQ